MNNFKWYVLRVISGQEAKIKLYFDIEIKNNNLDKYIVKTLIPYEKIYNKKKIKKKNFFSGYILIYANLFSNNLINFIKKFSGILGFLNSKYNHPEPIKQSEINRIFNKLDEIKELEIKLKKPFIIGEMVKIINGPFNNSSGIIKEIFKDKKKLSIIIKIFGRNTPIELSYMQIKKI